jgi:hypothetical protein
MDDVFKSLIESLSLKLDIEIAIADGRRAEVDFDGFALLIESLPDAGQILLAASVAAIPEDGDARLALYRELLKGQFLFADTQGATLSIDENETFVCLQAAPYTAALTRENFPVLVENFLNAAETWHGRCIALGEAGERTSSAPAPVLPDAGFLRV